MDAAAASIPWKWSLPLCRCASGKWNCHLSFEAARRRDDEDDGKKKWIHSAAIGAVAEEMGRGEKVEGGKMEEEDGRGRTRTEAAAEDRRRKEGRATSAWPAHPTESVIHRAIRRWATRFPGKEITYPLSPCFHTSSGPWHTMAPKGLQTGMGILI